MLPLVIARTHLQQLPVFSSLLFCIRRISYKTWILLPFIVGFRLRLALSSFNTIPRFVFLFASVLFSALSSTYRSEWTLSVRFDNNLILIEIHMQLAATIKQLIIINNQPESQRGDESSRLFTPSREYRLTRAACAHKREMKWKPEVDDNELDRIESPSVLVIADGIIISTEIQMSRREHQRDPTQAKDC